MLRCAFSHPQLCVSYCVCVCVCLTDCIVAANSTATSLFGSVVCGRTMMASYLPPIVMCAANGMFNFPKTRPRKSCASPLPYHISFFPGSPSLQDCTAVRGAICVSVLWHAGRMDAACSSKHEEDTLAWRLPAFLARCNQEDDAWCSGGPFIPGFAAGCRLQQMAGEGGRQIH